MTQRDLEMAISAATGEERSEIRRRGFSVVDPADVDFDPEPDNLPAQVIDWDDERGGSPLPMVADFHTFLKPRYA